MDAIVKEMIENIPTVELNKMLTYRPLYISKSASGNLLLHQRKMMKSPSHGTRYRKTVAYSNGYFIRGQVFIIKDMWAIKDTFIHLEDQIPCLLTTDVKENQTDNIFFVTRDKSGKLLLHTEEPCRIKETKDYNDFIMKSKKIWVPIGNSKFKKPQRVNTHIDRYCLKDANKWSVISKENCCKQHGHCYISEFPGSENIKFKDKQATKVTIII